MSNPVDTDSVVNRICRFVTLSLVTTFSVLAEAELKVGPGDWLSHGRDYANTKYSPLDQINADNFMDLEIAWRWGTISGEVTKEYRRIRLGQFKPTPIVAGGMMYVITAVCQIVALDAGTGEQLWVFDPKSYEGVRPANVGYHHRGLSYWSDGKEARIFAAVHDRKLWAIDAKTGKPCPDFGEKGHADLEHNLGRVVNPRMISHSSPVGICRDTVIVGSVVRDGGATKKMPPGHVRGFDARTGKMKWIFNTIPQEGEFGVETWENESWKYTGNTNVWGTIASDEELGYVYLPISTPTNDLYGGARLGDNLFGDTLVCVNSETGERVWHFQAIHHGLWDYDLCTAPNLADVTVDGKPRKIIAQVSKQGFCYVFDRATGEPIWPIEERSVPSVSSVPGERPSPTQPFPTKPAPYSVQGFTEDSVLDFTPELKAAALKAIEGFTLGPMYTPPTQTGTIGQPTAAGGVNWQGVALDPESGVLYVPSMNKMAFWWVNKPDPARSNHRYKTGWYGVSSGGTRLDLSALQGLPLVKPPYSSITAIDLNTGDHIWMTPHGDGPINHPLLKDLDLPPLGGDGWQTGNGPLVTKSLLLVTRVGIAGGTERDQTNRFTVFDKKTGKDLGYIPLPADPNGNPASYFHQGKQYIAVAVGGNGLVGEPAKFPAEMVVLSLP